MGKSVRQKHTHTHWLFKIGHLRVGFLTSFIGYLSWEMIVHVYHGSPSSLAENVQSRYPIKTQHCVCVCAWRWDTLVWSAYSRRLLRHGFKPHHQLLLSIDVCSVPSTLFQFFFFFNGDGGGRGRKKKETWDTFQTTKSLFNTFLILAQFFFFSFCMPPSSFWCGMQTAFSLGKRITGKTIHWEVFFLLRSKIPTIDNSLV